MWLPFSWTFHRRISTEVTEYPPGLYTRPLHPPSTWNLYTISQQQTTKGCITFNTSRARGNKTIWGFPLQFPKIIAIDKKINLRGKQVFVSGNVNDVSQIFERKAKRLMELEGVWINIQYTVEANYWKEAHEFDVLLCFIKTASVNG